MVQPQNVSPRAAWRSGGERPAGKAKRKARQGAKQPANSVSTQCVKGDKMQNKARRWALVDEGRTAVQGMPLALHARAIQLPTLMAPRYALLL